MVHQKRLGYGFNGYQVPSMPRGSRSARGRRTFKKKVDSDNMCAFNLLATVAGELLQEKESSLSPNSVSAPLPSTAIGIDAVKREQQDQVRNFKEEPFDQGSCDESVLSFQKRVQKSSEIDVLKDYSHAGECSYLRCASLITKSDGSGKVAHEDLTVKSKNSFGSSTVLNHGLVGDRRDGIFSGYCKGKDDHPVRDIEIDQENRCFTAGVFSNMCFSEDPMVVDTKPPTLVSSDSSAEVPQYRDHVLYTKSFGSFRNDVKVVKGDDDENSSGCTDPGTRTMRSYKPPRIGDRRIRKFMASKFYKVSPTIFKNGDFSNFDYDMKPVFRSRKLCYARQRNQRFSTYKRRKFFERCSTLASHRGNSSEGLSNSPRKAFLGESSVSSAKKHGANGTSSSLVGERSAYKSGDSHVKLRIKSFKVPELLIEIPETATVGLLKRTVLEAVTAILGSGIRVGVLLQGKKVRDDSKTLLQSGISLDEKLDGLGFALEPGSSQSALPPLCKEETQFLQGDNTLAVSRHPTIPPVDKVTSDASIEAEFVSFSHSDESISHALVRTPTDMVSDKASPSSQALVAISALSVEALAVVPLQQKCRRPELAQRRIRRPFSVAEVEALVQAVEKLGTGRWRDVKLRAFENAKHRTYVDLKDKWKTLVHTARISPQQRRGEPVPQELLDRVLSAHAYWSQQQAKQQIKQQEETCLLL